jgi:hypothetical protein
MGWPCKPLFGLVFIVEIANHIPVSQSFSLQPGKCRCANESQSRRTYVWRRHEACEGSNCILRLYLHVSDIYQRGMPSGKVSDGLPKVTGEFRNILRREEACHPDADDIPDRIRIDLIGRVHGMSSRITQNASQSVKFNLPPAPARRYYDLS